MYLKIITKQCLRSTVQGARCILKFGILSTTNSRIICGKFNRNILTYSLQNSELVKIATRSFSAENGSLTPVVYEQKCNETLDSLSEYFEQLIEESPHLKYADVIYDDGVLTVKFGDPYGTYVINRQTPNLQIWLSSPTSGPKRYDFKDGCWVYRHDSVSLHELLNNEIPKIVKREVDFFKCAYSNHGYKS